MNTVAIIGGGAAGLIAAISAAKSGASVTVYERTDRVGKKILATGNGRCNFTNINADLRHYHGQQSEFILGAKKQFWVKETLEFFDNLGVLAKEEENGKIYPYSGQAASILDVLRIEAARLSVETVCGFEASKINRTKNGFEIISYDGQRAFAERVIVTAGGRAAPNLGSNGSGYSLLECFGHKKTNLFPALVQLKTDTSIVRGLKGIKFDGVLTLRRGSHCECEKGEILFTEYGISGPPVFSLSRLAEGKECTATLDLMPEYDEAQIFNLLKNRKSTSKNLEVYLVGMLNKKLAQALLKFCGFSPLSLGSASLSDEDLRRISATIKGWRFPVIGTLSWNNAQVTAGGIRTDGFFEETLESRLAKGLFAAGEILDIDGDCGGFNLQWAWSSGYVAGKSAARCL